MEKNLSWQERRDLTQSLKDVKVESTYDDNLGEYEVHAESRAAIDRAVEVIDWQTYELDRLRSVIDAYRTVLKEALR